MILINNYIFLSTVIFTIIYLCVKETLPVKIKTYAGNFAIGLWMIYIIICIVRDILYICGYENN